MDRPKAPRRREAKADLRSGATHKSILLVSLSFADCIEEANHSPTQHNNARSVISLNKGITLGTPATAMCCVS